jgi:hypothetical protein
MSVGNALLLSAIPFDEVFDGQKHEAQRTASRDRFQCTVKEGRYQ